MLMFNRVGKYLLIVLFIFCCGQIPVRAESRFPILVVAGTSYTNVVVIQKTADNVFIQHNGGIASFKVTDLNDALRSQFGLPPRPVTTNLISSAQPNKSPTLAGNSHQKQVAQPAPGIAEKKSQRVFQYAFAAAAGTLVLVILLIRFLRIAKLKGRSSQATTESGETESSAIRLSSWPR